LDCIDKGEDIIQFDTGGWKTVTTKERMNRFASVSIWSERHIWYISKSFDWDWKRKGLDETNPIFHFEDGMFMQGNQAYRKEHGELVKLKPFSKEAEKAKRKQLRQIDSFIKEYVNRLMNGQLGTPSAGDCFMCQGESNSEFAEKMYIGELDSNGKLVTKQGIHPDHLLSHIEEKYYVPSMLWSAIRSQCYDPDGMFGNPNMTYGLAPIDKHNISVWMNPNTEHKTMASDMTGDRIKKIMKKYFINRLEI
jgi:hypothetical protein